MYDVAEKFELPPPRTDERRKDDGSVDTIVDPDATAVAGAEQNGGDPVAPITPSSGAADDDEDE